MELINAGVNVTVVVVVSSFLGLSMTNGWFEISIKLAVLPEHVQGSCKLKIATPCLQSHAHKITFSVSEF
jgi:hypothetical protein